MKSLLWDVLVDPAEKLELEITWKITHWLQRLLIIQPQEAEQKVPVDKP